MLSPLDLILLEILGTTALFQVKLWPFFFISLSLFFFFHFFTFSFSVLFFLFSLLILFHIPAGAVCMQIPWLVLCSFATLERITTSPLGERETHTKND